MLLAVANSEDFAFQAFPPHDFALYVLICRTQLSRSLAHALFQQVFGFSERVFRFFALSDIDGYSHCRHRPTCVEYRRIAYVYPDKRAVLAFVTLVHIEGLSTLRHFPEAVFREISLFGMRDCEEGLRREFRLCVPEHFAEFPVSEQETAG